MSEIRDRDEFEEKGGRILRFSIKFTFQDIERDWMSSGHEI